MFVLSGEFGDNEEIDCLQLVEVFRIDQEDDREMRVRTGEVGHAIKLSGRLGSFKMLSRCQIGALDQRSTSERYTQT
jgi:hypothetical protein